MGACKSSLLMRGIRTTLFLASIASTATASDLQFLPGDTVSGPAIGSQDQPAIAAGANLFLAVWQDYRTSPYDGPPWASSGGGSDIYALRLDASGVPVDTAPIIVSAEFGDQSSPHVAWNGQSWLVAWSTPAKPWLYSQQILAARISPDGVVLDPTPIVVHSQGSTRFAMTANGSEWLVVLESLRAVRVSAGGAIVNPGGTALYNATTQVVFNVASAQGEYLLLWWDYTTRRAQRFAADLTPIGSAFFVPAVDVGSNGTEYFLAWVIDDTYWEDSVLGQALSVSGVLGPIVTLARSATGLPLWNPAEIHVGWNGTSWQVSWLELTRGVVFTRVTTSGTVLDPGARPVDSSALSSTMIRHAVASAPSGVQYAWRAGRGGAGTSPDDIYTASVPSAGSAVLVSAAAPAQLHVDFATGATEVMAVFLSGPLGSRRIVAQRLNGAGNALDPEPVEVASGPAVGVPHVAWDGFLYLVVWSEGSQIFGRRLRPDGSLVDAAPLLIMAGESPDAAGLDGTFLVVGTQQTIGPHFFHPFAMRVEGASGQRLDPQPVLLGQYFARYPRVIAFAGRWLAVWQRNFSHDDPNSEVMAAFIEPDGTTPGEFRCDYGGAPDVAASAGIALIVWRAGTFASVLNNILGRTLLSSGAFGSATFKISAGPKREFGPAVTWDGAEFVVAWEDRRNEVIYFDQRSEVYASRVSERATVLDPSGFAFGGRAEPELLPALAGFQGKTLIAASSFRDESALRAYRMGYQLLGDGVNAWPVAVAAAQPVSGDAPLTVTFSAAGSDDPDGLIVSYAWDFGDGQVASVPDPIHPYALPAEVLPQLTVTDDQGSSTSNGVRVNVTPVNRPPLAVASADRTAGPAPLSVVYSAEGSYDPDDSIQNYFWDFGDGWTYWGSTAYHTYSQPGTWVTTLTVYDLRGATATDTLIIEVGAPNQPPVAIASASPASGPVPLAVSFSSAGSSDPDGTISAYSWKFGDGTGSTLPNPGHTYGAAGGYAATLTVTDDRGATGTASVTVTATDVLRSTAINLSARIRSGTVTVTGQVVVKDSRGAAVPGATVAVVWKNPGGATVSQAGTTDAKGVATFRTSGARGTYTLTVTDITKPAYTFDKANSVLSKSITK